MCPPAAAHVDFKPFECRINLLFFWLPRKLDRKKKSCFSARPRAIDPLTGPKNKVFQCRKITNSRRYMYTYTPSSRKSIYTTLSHSWIQRPLFQHDNLLPLVSPLRKEHFAFRIEGFSLFLNMCTLCQLFGCTQYTIFLSLNKAQGLVYIMWCILSLR